MEEPLLNPFPLFYLFIFFKKEIDGHFRISKNINIVPVILCSHFYGTAEINLK